MDDDIDSCAGSRQRFIDRVVDHFVNEMVQGFDVRPAHVHAGTAADGFQSFQDLNAGCIVIIGLCHSISSKNQARAEVACVLNFSRISCIQELTLR